MRRWLRLLASPIACLLLFPIAADGRREATIGKLSLAVRRSCQKSGGSIKRVGMAQAEACVRLYPDRGKQCTGPSDCKGECRFLDDTRPIPVTKPRGSRRQSSQSNWNPPQVPPIGSKAAGQCQWSADRFGCRATVVDGRIKDDFCLD